MHSSYRPTVKQLIYKNKVILHSLLIEFPEVPLPQPNESIEKLKDDCSVRIALGDRRNVDILVLDMAERCTSERQDRGADLRVGNDLDAEDVCKPRTAVLSKCAEDEVLTLLIEEEDPGEHVDNVELNRVIVFLGLPIHDVNEVSEFRSRGGRCLRLAFKMESVERGACGHSRWRQHHESEKSLNDFPGRVEVSTL